MIEKSGIITLIFLVFLVNYMFFVGMHNLDNAWNMRTTELDTGFIYCDYNLLGTECKLPGDVYQDSIILLMVYNLLVTFLYLGTIAVMINRS